MKLPILMWIWQGWGRGPELLLPSRCPSCVPMLPPPESGLGPQADWGLVLFCAPHLSCRLPSVYRVRPIEREAGRETGREREMEGGKERGRQAERDGWRKGEREGGREGGRQREREGGRQAERMSKKEKGLPFAVSLPKWPQWLTGPHRSQESGGLPQGCRGLPSYKELDQEKAVRT